jgi:hypothetical protein
MDAIGAEFAEEKGKVYLVNDDDIPDYGTDWFTRDHENPNGPIPASLTFYDNDDGYWDDWIKTKRERAGPPEIFNRPWFKH